MTSSNCPFRLRQNRGTGLREELGGTRLVNMIKWGTRELLARGGGGGGIRLVWAEVDANVFTFAHRHKLIRNIKYWSKHFFFSFLFLIKESFLLLRWKIRVGRKLFVEHSFSFPLSLSYFPSLILFLYQAHIRFPRFSLRIFFNLVSAGIKKKNNWIWTFHEPFIFPQFVLEDSPNFCNKIATKLRIKLTF